MHPPYTHTPDLASAVLDVHDVNDSVHTSTFTIQYFHSFADAHFSVRGRSLFSSRTLTFQFADAHFSVRGRSLTHLCMQAWFSSAQSLWVMSISLLEYGDYDVMHLTSYIYVCVSLCRMPAATAVQQDVFISAHWHA
jgi:hypothetical protein